MTKKQKNISYDNNLIEKIDHSKYLNYFRDQNTIFLKIINILEIQDDTINKIIDKLIIHDIKFKDIKTDYNSRVQKKFSLIENLKIDFSKNESNFNKNSLN